MEGSRRRRAELLGPGHGGGADLISALPEDVLLEVLVRLCCARAAACTSLLSRRWCGLWTRLPELTFRYVALDRLRSVLASIGATAVGPGVTFLDIAFTSAEAAAGLPLVDSGVYRQELEERLATGLPSLLHAAAGLSLVEIRLALPLSLENADVDLPGFHHATSIPLHAWYLRLTLPPSNDGFPKLQKLTLSGCRVDLAALVLSFPCLPVLRVTDTSLGADINIQSESLQRLFLRTNQNFRWTTDRVNIQAPMLKQLSLSFSAGDVAKLSVSVVAPILEKLIWECSYSSPRMTHAPGPWGLRKLNLHAPDCCLGQQQRVTTGAAGEDASSLLLPNANVLSLQMTARGPFHAPPNFVQQIEKHLVADFSVLHLTLVYDNVYASPAHVFGPFVLHLLGMHRIRTATRRLQIHFLRSEVKGRCRLENCPCDEPKSWRSKNISLIKLEEVEIKGFLGEDHEFDFLRVIFRCAPMLKRMSVRMSDEATSSAKDRCTKIHQVFEDYPFVECNLTQRSS